MRSAGASALAEGSLVAVAELVFLPSGGGGGEEKKGDEDEEKVAEVGRERSHGGGDSAGEEKDG